MKEMEQIYIDGEKNAQSISTRVDGKSTEIREKEWKRAQMDQVREKQGQKPFTDREWRNDQGTTIYMNEKQKGRHNADFAPDRDSAGNSTRSMDPALLDQAFKAQATELAGLKKSLARMNQDNDPADKPAIKALEGEVDRIEKLQAAGQVDMIFVMDGEGQTFAKGFDAAHTGRDINGRQADVHHASFLAGEAVAGAGEMMVDRQGVVKEITDGSGHYRPGEAQNQQTLAELQNQGMNLDNTKFTKVSPTGRTTGMAGEYQQGGEQVFKQRHQVADAIKTNMESTRQNLDQEATQRAASVKEAMNQQNPAAQKADLQQAKQSVEGRQDLLSQIKDNGKDVRAMLDKDADRRGTRVRKGAEHIAGGMDAGEVHAAAKQHADKDEKALGAAMGDAREKQGLKPASVREQLGGSLGRGSTGTGRGISAK